MSLFFSKSWVFSNTYKLGYAAIRNSHFANVILDPYNHLPKVEEIHGVKSVVDPVRNVSTQFEIEQPGLIDAKFDSDNLFETTLNSLGEPSIAFYGLGGNYPPGLLQQLLEYLHCSGAPWWVAIAGTTCVIRLLLYPLVIKSQRYAAAMSYVMPKIQKYQQEMFQARRMGDPQEVLRTSLVLRNLIQEHNVKPFRSMIMPLIQAPIFISFFWALRAMANAPVESMKEGGLYWFADLTSADPYYILPLVTACTLWLTIEFATEGIRIQSMPYMKYIIRAMPIGVFIFSINFPSAILCYWCANNLVSLLQVGFLRLPGVRTYFGIEKPKSIPPKDKESDKSIRMKFKDAMENNKILREIEDRIKVDAFNFKQAGLGPLPKTFDHDPTQSVEAAQLLKKLTNNAHSSNLNTSSNDPINHLNMEAKLKEERIINEIREKIKKRL